MDEMSRPDAGTREPPARRVPAAPGRPSSRRPRACSSSAATPPRPSRRSATARTPRRPRCTGCSLPSSGSSRPCSTSRSEVTTRRWPWRTARRSGRSSQPRTRRASWRRSPRCCARSWPGRARSPHPGRRGPVRPGRGVTADRDRPATSRGPAGHRPLAGSVRAPCGPGSRSATPPTSSTPWRPPRFTACSSPTGAGPPSATRSG